MKKDKHSRLLKVFVKSWISNGQNAKQAYLTIHPNISEHSAETLGSRMLRKINISDIVEPYFTEFEIYMRELKEGLNAVSYNRKLQRYEPDHLTRFEYLKTLGALLGFTRS